jgi:hypothetical protein
MRSVGNRTFVGTPGEPATLATTLENGGALRVTLDGVPVASNLSFPLGADGSSRVLVLTLAGPEKAACTVRISTVVPGGTEVDRLEILRTLPAPVHDYHFLAAVGAVLGAPVAPPVMVAEAAGSRGAPAPMAAPPPAMPAPPAAAAARPAKKAPKESAKKAAKAPAKKVAKKTARKPAAPRTRKPASGRARPAKSKTRAAAGVKKGSRKSAKTSPTRVKKVVKSRSTKSRRAGTGKRGRK